MAGNFWTSSAEPRKWVKGNVVGAGSFGVVNLAMNKSTGELFAVKSALCGDGLRSLENEANILENLDSPYIVRCLGREISNGEQKIDHLFMEFMSGGSLSDEAEKFGGVIDETVIRLYTKEILHGLEYLHNNGIVHGDLKCKNVLVGSSGNVKLADFGSAKRLQRSLKTDGKSKYSWQSICGTPLWTAPEVLRNEGLSFASDIWSLGCTIVEMATGRPPWGYNILNPMAAVLKIACGNDTPQLPTKFSEEGLDFLAKCFQRDPEMRWTSSELLEHPFVSKSSGKHWRKEAACSPVSVFEFGLYESDHESDELVKPLREEIPKDELVKPLREEIPRASMLKLKRHGNQRERSPGRRQMEEEMMPSENWVTVR